MAKGNFQRCHGVTSVWEGGWSDHKADPGGATMCRITNGKFREHYPSATAADLRRITKAQAIEIYRKDFWAKISGERLAAGVDLAAYDASVNSGVSRGEKWLMASLGGPDHETVKKICARRLGFMQSLKIWKTFGRGWANRVADIEAKGVAWALAATHDKAIVKQQLDDEATAAEKKANNRRDRGRSRLLKRDNREGRCAGSGIAFNAMSTASSRQAISPAPGSGELSGLERTVVRSLSPIIVSFIWLIGGP